MILNNLRNDTPKWQVLVFSKLKHLNCVSLWASRAARVNKIQQLLSLRDWLGQSRIARTFQTEILYLFFLSYPPVCRFSSSKLTLFLVACLLSLSLPLAFFLLILLACFFTTYFILSLYLIFFLSFYLLIVSLSPSFVRLFVCLSPPSLDLFQVWKAKLETIKLPRSRESSIFRMRLSAKWQCEFLTVDEFEFDQKAFIMGEMS